MRFLHNVDSRETETVDGYGTLFQRGHEEEFTVSLVDQAGEVVALEAGDAIRLDANIMGERDDGNAFSVTVTLDDEHATEDDVYTTLFSTVTAAINALLVVDNDKSNDQSSKTIDCCITYIPAGSDGRPGKKFQLEIENPPYRVENDTPLALPAPVGWLLLYGMLNPGYWTAYEGGTLTCLDAVVIADYPLGHCFDTAISGDSRRWQIMEGTDATDVPNGILRTLDYAPSTNERVLITI